MLHNVLGVTVRDTRLVAAEKRRRSAERQRLSVPARLTWKDASGAVRFVSVTTRDISEAGAFVNVEGTTAIPLYRLVHVQLEKGVRDNQDLPAKLREGRVLSAVWRVGPCQASTGKPTGYALRFLVAPRENLCARPSVTQMAVAS
jgi:PilZ domain